MAALPRVLQAQAPAPETGTRIWQGVFTAAQAARGKKPTPRRCRRCHPPDRRAVTAPGSSATGSSTAGGRAVDRLYLKIAGHDVPRTSGRCSTIREARGRRFILQSNGFPAALRKAWSWSGFGERADPEAGQQALCRIYLSSSRRWAASSGRRRDVAVDAHRPTRSPPARIRRRLRRCERGVAAARHAQRSCCRAWCRSAPRHTLARRWKRAASSLHRSGRLADHAHALKPTGSACD